MRPYFFKLKFLPLFVLILILDIVTKNYFARNYQLGESHPIIDGFFNFTLVHNRGAAFGMGSQWSQPFFLVTTFLALGVVLYLLKQNQKHETLARVGLVMIIAGAVGNVIDRISLGYVIDFLDVYVKNYHWPVFNIADSAISVGAVLFILDPWFQKTFSKQFEKKTTH